MLSVKGIASEVKGVRKSVGWVSSPFTCIPWAVPDATTSPLNHNEYAFESFRGESDNTPTLLITGSGDATMHAVPRGFALVLNINHIISKVRKLVTMEYCAWFVTFLTWRSYVNTLWIVVRVRDISIWQWSEDWSQFNTFWFVLRDREAWKEQSSKILINATRDKKICNEG